MNLYIVAICSLGSGELTMHKTEAEYPLDACNQVLETDFEHLNDVFDYMANQDSYINFVKV